MLTAAVASPAALFPARAFLAVGAALTSLEGAAYANSLQQDKLTTPLAAWLPDVSTFPATTWFLVMVAAALGLLVGLLPGACAAVLAVGSAWPLVLDQQLYSNHRVLLVLLCVWFVFARADRMGAPGARERREHHGALVPWWPQLLVVATVSSCYLFAGLSKVNPVFLSGATIAELAPAWVPAQLAAWATPPTEIAIGLGLWSRRGRSLAIPLGLGLHASIIVLLDSPLVFGAFALVCLTAYPLAGFGGRQRTTTPVVVPSARGVGPAS